ncbi:hypothetical protein VRK_27710 [Vibrio sp. MEBiC08052]|nr:hypothetical protein VRK_27710 [Vibrio sp. MEBiC08052]
MYIIYELKTTIHSNVKQNVSLMKNMILILALSVTLLLNHIKYQSIFNK